MKTKKILIITHINYIANKEVHGPAHTLINYLNDKNYNINYIFHPLDSGDYSYFNNGSISLKYKRSKNSFLNYLIEIMINTKIILNNNYYLVIAIDPLNAFLFGISKLYKKHKLVYFSVDYSDKRFENFYINCIYHFIDRFCVMTADSIWAVSTRIVKKRKEQTLAPIYLIPNSPLLYFKKPITKVNNQIILVTSISKSINFGIILHAICEIKTEIPDIKMIIIGDGPLKLLLKEQISKLNLQNNVLLAGLMPNNEVLEVVAKSKIGLALYSGESAWNYYGDSMKAREYAARATPIILNNIPSTADDIKKFTAGIILDKECNGLKEAILKLLNDSQYYEECIKGCIEFSKEYDYMKNVEKGMKGFYEL